MKRFERGLLILLLTATFVASALALLSLLQAVPVRWKPTSDLFGTAGLLAALSGFVQLDVSGFFDRIMSIYSDEEKYPFGPPSRVTREIIDNPDKPARTRVRNELFFSPRTGFWLVCYGTALQIVSLWT